MRALSKLILICSIQGVLCVGQDPPLIATAGEVKAEPCARDRAGFYELAVVSAVRVKNVSQRNVLMPRSSVVLDGVRVARSDRDMREGKFLFAIEPEFFSDGSKVDKAPGIDDFVSLKPGGEHVLSLNRTFEGASRPQKRGRPFLTRGRYWVQFRFWTLPEYFYYQTPEVLKDFSEKWVAAGALLNVDVWTEPFALDVRFAGAKSCRLRQPRALHSGH